MGKDKISVEDCISKESMEKLEALNNSLGKEKKQIKSKPLKLYFEKQKEEAADPLKEEWETLIEFFILVESEPKGKGYSEDMDIGVFCKKNKLFLDPYLICKELSSKQIISTLLDNVGQAIFCLEVNGIDKYFTYSKVALPKVKSYTSKEEVVKITKVLSEEEILKIAEDVMSNIKNEDSESIINIFKAIALPFDDGNGLKEKVLLKVFELASITASYEKDIGIIVPALSKRKILLVSHIDLITTFNKGFNEDNIVKIEGEMVIGALDNTMTNAVALMSFISLRLEGKAEDIELLFTEGEEIDLLGMKEYFKKFPSVDGFFVNMDVSNDNWKKNISIEYDNPSYRICQQLAKNLGSVGIQDNRDCDDFDVIERKGGKGFSYCLPTDKGIHSYRNYTLKEKLTPYLKGLKYILSELNVEKCEADIENLSIKKALKCETYKKFKKKEEEKKKEKEAKRKEAAARKPLYSDEERGWKSYRDPHSHKYEEDESNPFRNEDGTPYNFDKKETTYSYGRSKKEMAKECMERFGVIPQGFDETPDDIYELEKYGNYTSGPLLSDECDEDYEDYISKQNVYEIEKVASDSIAILKSNGIDLDKIDKKFINEHVYAQDQWSIDDLAGFIGSMKKAESIIMLLDEYFLIEQIDNGVYKFPKKSVY